MKKLTKYNKDGKRYFGFHFRSFVFQSDCENRCYDLLFFFQNKYFHNARPFASTADSLLPPLIRICVTREFQLNDKAKHRLLIKNQNIIWFAEKRKRYRNHNLFTF